MKNIFKILKFEYLTCVRNKAFIIVTIVMVCISLFFSFIPGLITSMISDSMEPSEDKENIIAISKSGYKDELIKSKFSAFYPAYTIKITDEDQKTIEKKVDSEEYSFAIQITSPNTFTHIVKDRLVYDSDSDIALNIMQDVFKVTELEKRGLSDEDIDTVLNAPFAVETVVTGSDHTKNYMPVYLLMCVLYVAIVSFSNTVTQSVVSEKNTRTMELLITCADPKELMFGKVIGAGLAGLTQLTLIFLSLFASMNYSPVDAIPAEIKDFINFPAETLLLALMFFILGYFIYAFLLGALASFASKSEDLSGLISPVTFILMALYFILIFLCSGDMVDSTVMTVLSYIPLSAPMAMFIRAVLLEIPVWEVIVSVVLQLATIYLFGLMAAAIYRIGVLMYGNPPKPAEIFKMLLKK